MHLLLAQKGSISDGEKAIDLGQSAGDIVFLTAADTELSAIAAAVRARGEAGPKWRLASLMALKHPMSVDTYVERTARHARLIVVRALGGASYFQYALEALHAAAQRSGAMIAVLPGDDKPDEGLSSFSNLAAEDLSALWAYLIEGGDANAGGVVAYAEALVAGTEKPEPARPLLKAGIWWPGRGVIGVEEWRRCSGFAQASTPVIAICFYRALVQSGETKPVEALIDALKAEGLAALPVFVSSLKDAVSVDTLRAIFAEAPPAVVINATGFAVSAPGAERRATVLDEGGAVVLQAIFSASAKEAWQASNQGLSARDLAMNVALPEVDGRVLARAVSFKSAARFDERVEANIVTHEPEPGRVAFVAALATRWARLRQTPAAGRRVALIMANYPNRDGRLGNGVGLDTPTGTIEVLRAMEKAGYAVGHVPENGDAL
ncbi:MAG TPA: cobaltochelatase subunit CobN, partial [Rhizobium sp.]|nr:cobaltochelatase subunit CobN [Rhizobium sp.]